MYSQIGVRLCNSTHSHIWKTGVSTNRVRSVCMDFAKSSYFMEIEIFYTYVHVYHIECAKINLSIVCILISHRVCKNKCIVSAAGSHCLDQGYGIDAHLALKQLQKSCKVCCSHGCTKRL